MKVKSFLLTALAASMTFVACDNKDDEMGQLDNTPKSVSIDLSNVIPVTRGAGQEVEDNSKVSLTDLQVFFTDGTTLYKGKTIEGTEATHYFSNKSNFDDRADKVFHFLPAEVNKVIVVGNNGSQINASTYVDLKKDLIIAEQHIIILYPVFILPFRFVVAFRTHPLVILSPCLRILSVFFFPSKEIGFHITGVICRIIPERPCFGGMIFLPGIVHLFNHLPNLLSISFFCEGK